MNKWKGKEKEAVLQKKYTLYYELTCHEKNGKWILYGYIGADLEKARKKRDEWDASESALLMLMSEDEAAKYTESVVETTPEPTETELEPDVTESAPVEKPKTNMIPAILALLTLAGGGGFFVFKKVQEKKKKLQSLILMLIM